MTKEELFAKYNNFQSLEDIERYMDYCFQYPKIKSYKFQCVNEENKFYFDKKYSDVKKIIDNKKAELLYDKYVDDYKNIIKEYRLRTLKDFKIFFENSKAWKIFCYSLIGFGLSEDKERRVKELCIRLRDTYNTMLAENYSKLKEFAIDDECYEDYANVSFPLLYDD